MKKKKNRNWEKCRPAVSGKVLGAHICQLFAVPPLPKLFSLSPFLLVVAVLLARTLCAANKFSEKFSAAETRNGQGRPSGGRGEGGRRGLDALEERHNLKLETFECPSYQNRII